MGAINLTDVTLVAGERELVRDVNLNIDQGEHVALVGPNGVGKSTLLRAIAGLEDAVAGTIATTGLVRLLDQFVARAGDPTTVEQLLLHHAPPALARLRRRLAALETRISVPDAPTEAQLEYADALAEWGAAGGYDLEASWEAACDRALGRPLDALRHRTATSLSGGEQKRLVLELLFTAPADVLLLDEPDNFLDVEGKRWLEARIDGSDRTIVVVSHDRSLIEAVARRIVTLEGGGAWSYVGRFSGYDEAREARAERLQADQRRWDEKREQLERDLRRKAEWARRSDKLASPRKAAETRLRRFESTRAEVVAAPRQRVSIRLPGSRSGNRVLIIEGLGMRGLFEPFAFEARYGDRVCLIGANGTGKSHFLRLLAGERLPHTGGWRLGSRVRTGYFSQMIDPPRGAGECGVVELVQRTAQLDVGGAMAGLSRYGLRDQASLRFEQLSGGQRARLSLLCLESEGANLLLLDEPTDNLDIESAEALEHALGTFEGTVLAVSHDRWFINKFETFLVFSGNGRVTAEAEPTYDLAVPALRRRLHADQDRAADA